MVRTWVWRRSQGAFCPDDQFGCRDPEDFGEFEGHHEVGTLEAPFHHAQERTVESGGSLKLEQQQQAPAGVGFPLVPHSHGDTGIAALSWFDTMKSDERVPESVSRYFCSRSVSGLVPGGTIPRLNWKVKATALSVSVCGMVCIARGGRFVLANS